MPRASFMRDRARQRVGTQPNEYRGAHRYRRPQKPQGVEFSRFIY
jgi:hypothetical protein